VDVLTVQDADGSTITTEEWHHSNPQTQEPFQAPGAD